MEGWRDLSTVVTSHSAVVLFYPEEVNQQRVGPSHNNSTHRKGALLLQLRTFQCMDVEQSSSEEYFMGPE
jgi:hypothetical protein